MKKFILNIATFCIGFIILFLIIYQISDYFLNTLLLRTTSDDILIWGDSQIYHGISLDYLREISDKRVFSAARPGAGCYDFLLFSEKVPEKSTVIVSPSQSLQIRAKDRDQSGLSIKSLYILFKSDYGVKEIFSIINKNLYRRKMFMKDSDLITFSEKIKINEPVSLFEKYFSIVPAYLSKKQKVIFEGMKNLNEKGCKIIIVEFPYYKMVNPIVDASPNIPFFNEHRRKIMKELGIPKIDEVAITGMKEYMHDLSHLNELGAKKASELIYNYSIKNGEDSNKYIVFKGR